MPSVTDLPHLNAALNTTSALLLTAGYIAIRQRRVERHRKLMLGASVVSLAFLVSYVIYHIEVGSVRFPGLGTVRVVYLAILASHVVLATAIAPLVLVTLARALRGQLEQHRRVARWTWPLWMYVSVTGVVVYVMLYHVYGGSAR